jgi:hypothetical protein
MDIVTNTHLKILQNILVFSLFRVKMKHFILILLVLAMMASSLEAAAIDLGSEVGLASVAKTDESNEDADVASWDRISKTFL